MHNANTFSRAKINTHITSTLVPLFQETYGCKIMVWNCYGMMYNEYKESVLEKLALILRIYVTPYHDTKYVIKYST